MPLENAQLSAAPLLDSAAVNPKSHLQRSRPVIRSETDFQQISFDLSHQSRTPVTAEKANEDVRKADMDLMQQSLRSSCAVWPFECNLRASPHPVVVPQANVSNLEIVHRLLSAAVTDIVERWWTDQEARFPQRMPLEQHEEEVLLWMSTLGDHLLPSYRNRQGSWRPDFLLEKVESAERYRICEINSRFVFNGFFYTAFAQQAYTSMDDDKKRLTAPAANPQDIFDGLFSLFNPSLPLHLLKGEEDGLDIHLFVSHVHSVSGRKPRLIAPSDLRLVSNFDSPTGFDLYCVIAGSLNDGESLEKIHQIGLELHQHELRALSRAFLREIALRCFNDFRTIFLVHDKRMLGIVLQELNSLVTKQKLFSPVEADILRHAITPTINPGSSGLAALRHFSEQTPQLREDFLLKPVRGGKGAGIVFGSDLSAKEWMLHLEKMQEAQLTPGRVKYVVQLRIRQPRVDVVLPGFTSLQHNYLVGTYMSIHGRFLGLGIWRTSPDRICAISRGGSWIGSVIATEHE